jgi:hypothetical protein
MLLRTSVFTAASQLVFILHLAFPDVHAKRSAVTSWKYLKLVSPTVFNSKFNAVSPQVRGMLLCCRDFPG